jgi:hypothetical protein
VIYLKLFILAVVAVTAYLQGEHDVYVKWDAEKHAQQVLAEYTQRKQAEATVQVVTKYIDRIQLIREEGRTITQKVTEYVPVNNCSVDANFVRMHDAAASGSYTETTGDVDGETATLKDTLAVVTENYENCRLNAVQLESLQEWAAKVSRD